MYPYNNDLEGENDYEEYDKGLTKDECGMIYHCEMSFLEALMHDLDLLAETALHSPMKSEVHHQRWNIALEKVVIEVDRLIEYPELFEDENIRKCFYQYVANFSEFLGSKFRGRVEPSWANEHNSMERSVHQSSLDADRLPWHQFLHHSGPGCPKKRASSLVNEFGLHQYIPPGGLHLLRGWEKDIRAYQHAIYPKIPAETHDGIMRKTEYSSHTLGAYLRYRHINGIVGAPKRFWEQVDPFFQSLETLSQDFGQWDVETENNLVNQDPLPYMFVASCTKDEWKRWKLASKTEGQAQNSVDFSVFAV